jgi:hypothetical protein
LDTARGPGSNRFRTSVYIIKEAIDTLGFNVEGYFLHVNDSTVKDYPDANAMFEKYSRANFVRAKRTASNTLRLLGGPSSVGEGTSNVDAIREYRFYLQKTEVDTTIYYIVTEKGYGGRADSTGYFSYSFSADKYYFGPREGTAKLTVKLKKSDGHIVANEVKPRPPVLEEAGNREIAVTGETGQVTVYNAAGSQIRIYSILGQMIADKIAASDNEVTTVPHGIAIVKIGTSITKKVVVK